MHTDFVNLLKNDLDKLDFTQKVNIEKDNLNKISQIEIQFLDNKNQVKKMNLYYSRIDSTELMVDLTPNNLPMVIEILNTIDRVWNTQVLVNKLENIENVSCSYVNNVITIGIGNRDIINMTDKIEFVRELNIDEFDTLKEILEVLKG